jgi:hypothetical protein
MTAMASLVGSAAGVGWRFWTVPPGTDILRAPIAWGFPSWPAREFRAVCGKFASHVPPERNCLCGVYADRSYKAVTARALAYGRQVNSWMSVARIAGQPVGFPPAYVAGRVRLEGAVKFSSPFLPKYDDEGELRAASAEILELYVLAGSCDPALGELLVKRYCVPVYV